MTSASVPNESPATTGHIVILSADRDRLEAALSADLTSPTGDVLYSPGRNRHCPGPAHPNLHSAVAEVSACAEVICYGCDETVCAGLRRLLLVQCRYRTGRLRAL